MAPIHRLHAQHELKNCSADQYYSFLKYDMAKLQRICPQFFNSFPTPVGDENGAGTIWLATLAMVGLFKVSMIDGYLLRKYPKIEQTFTVTPIVTQGHEQSCVVKLSVEYEKENENVPHPHEYMECAAIMNQAIARHVAKNA
ncbi:hypothetical protein MKW92_017361 [Papaver armeniacum]|nr:hypothetical protein MKW92_017361 [Papaver armeniacum]